MIGIPLTTTYKPLQVISVYKSTQESYYLESTPIYELAGKITYGASSPLSKATIGYLGEYFYKEGKQSFSSKKLLPKNLIYTENKTMSTTLVWYLKKSRQPLCFSPSLGIQAGLAWVPNLLFVAQGTILSVYAYKEEEIDLQTELYKAPFHNIYADGKVCMGNTRIEGVSGVEYADAIKTWQNLFFNSEFSHLLSPLSPTVSNINLLWKRLIETGEGFPQEELTAHKYSSVQTLINTL